MSKPKIDNAGWHTSDAIGEYAEGYTISTAWSTGVQHFYPLITRWGGTINALGLYQTAASLRVFSFKIGIYNSSGGRPTTLVTDFGTITSATSFSGNPGARGMIYYNAGTATIADDSQYWLSTKLISIGTTGTNSTSYICPRIGSTIASVRRYYSGSTGGCPYGFASGDFATTATGSLYIDSGLEMLGMGTGGLSADVSGTTPTIGSSLTGTGATAWLPNPWYTGIVAASGNDGWGWGQGGGQMWQSVF